MSTGYQLPIFAFFGGSPLWGKLIAACSWDLESMGRRSTVRNWPTLYFSRPFAAKS
jgi:hypothetical protein